MHNELEVELEKIVLEGNRRMAVFANEDLSSCE